MVASEAKVGQWVELVYSGGTKPGATRCGEVVEVDHHDGMLVNTVDGLRLFKYNRVSQIQEAR